MRQIRFYALILNTFVFLGFNPISAFCADSTDMQIANLYHTVYQDQTANPVSDMKTRLLLMSQHWLNKPYHLFPLGEGKGSDYDEGPRYRTDVFDCQTFVETVLALSLATDKRSFEQCMDAIRYKNAQVHFTTRNHFTAIDWNRHNQERGLLEDMTLSIRDATNQRIAVESNTSIDKKNWYQHLTQANIRLQHAPAAELSKRLRALQQEGLQFSMQNSRIYYIPLEHLVDENGYANAFLFAQIPDGAIIEIIRPNWDLRPKIGTKLDISHLGFVFWEDDNLFFYQASSTHNRVMKSLLRDYIYSLRKSPTIKGINIQRVVPQTPNPALCASPSQ